MLGQRECRDAALGHVMEYWLNESNQGSLGCRWALQLAVDIDASGFDAGPDIFSRVLQCRELLMLCNIMLKAVLSWLAHPGTSACFVDASQVIVCQVLLLRCCYCCCC